VWLDAGSLLCEAGFWFISTLLVPTGFKCVTVLNLLVKNANHQVFHSCSSLQGEQQNSETLMVSTSIIKHGIFEHGKIQARHGEIQVEIGMPLSKLPLVRRDRPVENWSI
jgi:hypothetical protein